jgi:uncharacterized membrane protein YccC
MATLYKYLTVAAAIISLLGGAYYMGYSRAETEGQLLIEELKKANAEAVISAQAVARGEYEKQIQQLSANLSAVRSDHAKRLRELEIFRNADRNLEACRRERERLADVAVRLEDLAGRAIGHLEAVAGQ